MEKDDIKSKHSKTIEQPEDSAGQAGNQESSIQEQPTEQQNQPEAKQPASTQDQAAGFELQLLYLITNAKNSNGLPNLSLNFTLNSMG